MENSLQNRKYLGGLYGARGYEFEKLYVLSQLPDWIARDLKFFQQELWSDLELFFESGSRWLVQIKNHPLELNEFRQVIQDFQIRYNDNKERYARFVIVATGLSDSVREVRNVLERWASVEHLGEEELASTKIQTADKFREYGLSEFEEFLFAVAHRIELRGDGNWIADEDTIRNIVCSKLITEYDIDLGTAQSWYLKTSLRISTERGTRIEIAPFREQLLGLRREKIDARISSVPFILPQLNVAKFTGRTVELSRLAKLLTGPGNENVFRVVALSGGGGIGKSALACFFAELHKNVFTDGVIGLRVDGKSNDVIAREFARLFGEEVAADDERDATTIMQEVFAHRKSLLIFDNANDAAIGSLLPGGTRCAVIITTRDRQLPSLVGIPESNQIDLSPLLDDEALSLLKELIGEERVVAELESIQSVMSLVGCLPLALQIVGATLQMQRGRSIENYEASLAEERQRLEKLKIRGASHLDVRASFAVSLKLLETEEIDFFACLSVCAPEGFSLASAMAAGGSEEARAHEWLGYLYRLSLLNSMHSDTYRFVFHPLIRTFSLELAVDRGLLERAEERHASYFLELVKNADLENTDTASTLSRELNDILLAGEWLQRKGVTDHDFVRSLQPFLQQNGYWTQAANLISGFLVLAEQKRDLTAIVLLRVQQAKFLSLSGKWDEAQSALIPVKEILNEIEPESSRKRIEAIWLNTFGGLLQRQGQLAKAVEAFQRSSFIEEELGNRRGQAKILNSLGGVLQRQGKFELAINAFRQSADIEKQLGNEHGEAMVLNSLGGALKRQGGFAEAISAFQRSYEIDLKLGDRRGQAMSLNSLGGALQQQGGFDEAVDAFQRSYELEQELGNMRGQAMVLNSLGSVLQRQGRFDDAVNAFQRSYELEQELGNKRGQAMVLNSLGGVLQRQGRFGDAVDAFQRSYKISEALDDQISLAMVLNSLGSVLQRQGRFDEAIDAFQRSYKISEALDDQISLAMVLNSLGGVLQRQGRFDEAIDAFRRSASMGEVLSDNRHVAMALNSLGGVLQRQGRFDEAIGAFRRSASMGEIPSDNRHVAMALNSLGGVLQRQGRFDEAVDAFRRSYELLVLLEDQRGQAMLLNSLGGVLQRQGRFNDAVDAFRRSASIGELLSDNRHVAMALNSLGGVLQRQGRFDDAVDAFQRAYDLEDKLGNMRGQAMVLNSLGGVLQRQGRFDNAVDAFRRSYKISESLDDQISLAMVLNSLGGALQRQGRFDDAVDAFQRSYKISESLGDQRSLAMVLNSLGGALQRQGRFDDAVDAFQRSYKISESVGDQRSLAMVLNSLGGVLQRQGRFDDAVDAFQRSYKISEALDDERSLAMVLNSLGGVLQRQGRFNEALEVFQRSYNLSKAIKDQVSLAMVHFGLAKTYVSLRNIDQAITEFAKSFEINEHLRIKRGILVVTPPLVETLIQAKHNEQAIDYCKRALVIVPDNTRLKKLLFSIES